MFHLFNWLDTCHLWVEASSWEGPLMEFRQNDEYLGKLYIQYQINS